MKRYLVTYKITHTREFWVKDVAQITSFFSPENNCEVLEVEEMPTDDEFKQV